MAVEFIRFLMVLRKLTGSKLARLAGVSRQAVSLWLGARSSNGQIQGRVVEMRIETLRTLASQLKIGPEILISRSNRAFQEFDAERLETKFNWDRLYPEIRAFFIGVARKEPRALARLVQVLGLFESAKIAGKVVWTRFDQYRNFIVPQRRVQCETVWKIQKDLALI